MTYRPCAIVVLRLGDRRFGAWVRLHDVAGRMLARERGPYIATTRDRARRRALRAAGGRLYRRPR